MGLTERRTIVVLGCYTPSEPGVPFHTEREQRAEVKRMKAVAQASARAVWPPVPKGIQYPKPDARHHQDPTVANHAYAWVNAALTPAWKRNRIAQADSGFEYAEREAQAEYALRLAKEEVVNGLS